MLNVENNQSNYITSVLIANDSMYYLYIINYSNTQRFLFSPFLSLGNLTNKEVFYQYTIQAENLYSGNGKNNFNNSKNIQISENIVSNSSEITLNPLSIHLIKFAK